MSFFVAIYGEVNFTVQSDTAEVFTPALIDEPYTLFEVSGDYMPANEVLVSMSYADGNLTIPDRDVTKINK